MTVRTEPLSVVIDKIVIVLAGSVAVAVLTSYENSVSRSVEMTVLGGVKLVSSNVLSFQARIWYEWIGPTCDFQCCSWAWRCRNPGNCRNRCTLELCRSANGHCGGGKSSFVRCRLSPMSATAQRSNVLPATYECTPWKNAEKSADRKLS